MDAPRERKEVVISVDSHVIEPDELWDRLPEEMHAPRPTLEPGRQHVPQLRLIACTIKVGSNARFAE